MIRHTQRVHIGTYVSIRGMMDLYGPGRRGRSRKVHRMSISAAQAKITSPLVGALEAAWRAIARRNPGLPPVAVVVSASTLQKGPAAWGHFAASRWTRGDVDVHELFVSAEGLARPAAEVFATLLHEAAHTMNHVHDVKDTSRGGRYHNDAFRLRAEAFGLDVERVGKIGWSGTKLSESGAAQYKSAITGLQAALTLYRVGEAGRGESERKSNNNGVSLVCPTCGRKVRMSNAANEAGPVVCWPCLAELTGYELDLDGFQFVPADAD